MRKYIILLFISAFALGACDKNDDYTVREWTVAFQLGISHGFHTLQPVLLVKANDDTSWRAVYEGIEGFDYEPGYEYKLRIKAKQLADPPQDASSVRYSLLELISKIPARSNIPDSYYPTFTMEVAPEPVSYYGELYLSVRFPEVGLNDWQRWPFRIEGFDYEQGYSYKLKVGTSVVGVDEGYYTVQYSVLEMLDKQPAQE